MREKVERGWSFLLVLLLLEVGADGGHVDGRILGGRRLAVDSSTGRVSSGSAASE